MILYAILITLLFVVLLIVIVEQVEAYKERKKAKAFGKLFVEILKIEQSKDRSKCCRSGVAKSKGKNRCEECGRFCAVILANG